VCDLDLLTPHVRTVIQAVSPQGEYGEAWYISGERGKRLRDEFLGTLGADDADRLEAVSFAGYETFDNLAWIVRHGGKVRVWAEVEGESCRCMRCPNDKP